MGQMGQIGKIAQIGKIGQIKGVLFLFPKGEFLKNSPEGSHWLECYHYLVLLVSKFYHPYDISSYCVVGGWVGG